MSPSEHRREMARTIAAAHQRLGVPGLMAVVSGSVADAAADDLSDIDMALTWPELPAPEHLRAACASVGAAPWHWQAGTWDAGEVVVAFRHQGIEVQIAYSSAACMERDLAEVLEQHNPDTPLHKLAEGLLKAQPLEGAGLLQALQQRVAAFPAPLARAMATHFLGRVTPWRAVPQLLQRDTLPWCRELQVQLCWRLLGALAGLNQRYFTTFQFKRLQAFADSLAVAPPALAQRMDQALSADSATAFALLHALEAEVLQLVARHWPEMDLREVRQRHQAFQPLAAPAG